MKYFSWINHKMPWKRKLVTRDWRYCIWISCKTISVCHNTVSFTEKNQFFYIQLMAFVYKYIIYKCTYLCACCCEQLICFFQSNVKRCYFRIISITSIAFNNLFFFHQNYIVCEHVHILHIFWLFFQKNIKDDEISFSLQDDPNIVVH